MGGNKRVRQVRTTSSITYGAFRQRLCRTNGRIFGIGLFSTMGAPPLLWPSDEGANHNIPPIGDHHRRQRKLLNPVFSAAHIRDLSRYFAFGVCNKFVSDVRHSTHVL